MKVVSRARELVPFHGGTFVPTMGALHAGHAALIAAARSLGRPVIVSVYVNGRQFGPAEDFERYPRTLEKDLAVCEAGGVDAVFTPTDAVIYPAGFTTAVTVGEAGTILCGATRPGHFDAVATVVARLFGLVRPSRAVFGWKDAQQFIVLRRMVEDLALGIEMVGVETVREKDGLALSSRNAYLSPRERELAPTLYKALRKGEAAAREGARAAEIVARVRRHLRAGGLEAEYVELRRTRDLSAVPEDKPPIRLGGVASRARDEILLAAAVRLGQTRLIDNVRFGA